MTPVLEDVLNANEQIASSLVQWDVEELENGIIE